jgi:apolipoprotein N-acyltransferase
MQWLIKHKAFLIALLASSLTSMLWVLALPPFDYAEAAYIAFVPILLWLYRQPSWRATLGFSFFCGCSSWCAILIWLRHVTYGGTLALSAIMALYFVLWVCAARWLLPVIKTSPFRSRLAYILALTASWILIEWLRSWLLWGFGWAPLALSQWQRPVVLQIAPWTGSYGVSALLILFNLCIAQTLYQRIAQRREKLAWFSPELYLAISCLAGCIYLFFKSLPQSPEKTELGTIGIVQPNTNPWTKWDPQLAETHLARLEKQSWLLSQLTNKLILWPEAATSNPILGDPATQLRVEQLSNNIKRPILTGSVLFEAKENLWYNGACLISPSEGLRSEMYIKRELVPFGEYVPRGFGFIRKVVPIGDNFIAGNDAGLLPLELENHTWQVGSLICYEDSFPHLARASAQAGAQLFFVATNNAWYGEEGGAYQHAAHSVLRAVETRRPVMRAGNAGWSGWIDSYGRIQEVLEDHRGSVYFKGVGQITVYQFDEWLHRTSAYTQWGDWIIAVAAVYAVPCWLHRWRRQRLAGY